MKGFDAAQLILHGSPARISASVAVCDDHPSTQAAAGHLLERIVPRSKHREAKFALASILTDTLAEAVAYGAFPVLARDFREIGSEALRLPVDALGRPYGPVCGQIVAALRDVEFASALEPLRRWAMGFTDAAIEVRASDAAARVEAVADDLAQWGLSQVKDDYQWAGERVLLSAQALRLEAAGSIVEVGVGSGGTLALLAALRPDRDVVGIDNFSYGGASQRDVVRAIEPVLVNVHVVEANSNVAEVPDRIAFLHLDAGHDYADVKTDVERYGPRVVVGGILAADDFLTRGDMPGVSKAILEFIHSQGDFEPVAAGPKTAIFRRVK